MRVAVSPGSGLLIVTSKLVAFSAEPIEEWFSLLAEEGDGHELQINRRMAALVVGKEFQVPPFAVIQRDPGSLFCFGNIEVLLGDGSAVNGAATSTWVEHPLSTSQLTGLSVGLGIDDRALLGDGTVFAGGFRLVSTQTQSGATVDLGQTEPAGTDVPSRLDAAPTPPDSLSQPASPVPAVPVSPAGTEHGNASPNGEPGVAAPHSAEAPAEPDDDWDPLADPDDLDLASIGAPAPAEPPTEVVSTALEAESAPQPNLVPERPAESSGMFSPGTNLANSDDSEPEVADEPTLAPPVRPPPRLGSDPVSGGVAPVAPAGGPPATGLVVEFDDGRSVAVVDGIYVGRHPSKRGLPDGFDAVVTDGETVSKVHWELVVDGPGVASVRDLGSVNGTFVQVVGSAQQEPVGTEAAVEIRPGATVHFGDRWARIQSSNSG